jgi:hypothetical protein
MIPIYPDLDWYASVSERKNLTVRCPYATVHRCPKYFESVWMLSNHGIMSEIPESLHNELLKKWQSHELWPVTDETATTISGGGRDKGSCISNLCPEVTFDEFNLFASKAIEFFDHFDREFYHRQLTEEGSTRSEKDWRWDFELVVPMHFSECPLYLKLYIEKPMS